MASQRSSSASRVVLTGRGRSVGDRGHEPGGRSAQIGVVVVVIAAVEGAWHFG